MLEEIARKYGNFHDAVILEIRYQSNEGYSTVEITVSCMNSEKDYDWEVIRIKCGKLTLFRFEERYNTSSTIITSALVKGESDLMTIDFFPKIIGRENFENPESDFIIKFKEMSYELIEG